MDENNSIQLFEDRKIRTAWDEEKEEWYFSVVDVIAVLTDQPTARSASTYWAVLKKRLKEEGASELLTNCKQLKMRATDGKMRLTDVASTEQLLRIIQSIPSPKAEPFRRWLAQVGRERIEETIDPEQAIDRALETYQKKGYDADWIHQRILSIRVRNELTAEWQARGVEQGREYAILTDEITKAWSGMTTRQYKNLKGLKRQNSGQHEHIGDRAEHAGRNHDHGSFPRPTGRRALRKAGSSPARRQGGWRRTAAPSKRTQGGPPSQRRTPPSSTPW